MIEISVNHPALKRLFDSNVPNSPALWAVLLGRHTGKVVVDSRQKPTQCVLRTDAALTYFSPKTQQAFLDESIEYFRLTGSIWLVWPAPCSLEPPSLEAAHLAHRVAFGDNDQNLDILSGWRQRLPVDFQIHPIDRTTLERCEWRDEMAFYCSSLENFLVNGIGLVMMRGDEIIAEAYASSLGKSRAEIGAITHEIYRGHCYAPIICAYLIEGCRSRGFQAYWSCDIDNPASIRVAQKLCLQQCYTYKIYEYEPNQ